MKKHPPTKPSILAAVVCGVLILPINEARAEFVAYHDFGALAGEESTGNITTHQSGDGVSPAALDTSAKDLIRFSDGVDTGVDFSVAGANGMDSRNAGEIGPPAAATPADALFNVTGLNLNNGTIFEGGNNGDGATTFTLAGLNPGLRYDLAFYGDRDASQDGVERFTLGGAESATNSSTEINPDAGNAIISPFVTEMQSPNATDGNVVRWTEIDPEADGTITIVVDPEVTSLSNIVYLSALRLEEVGAAAPFAITEIDYAPEAEEVTLTWRRTGASLYIAKFSFDLSDWESDLEDSITPGMDEDPDDTDHITLTFPLSDPVFTDVTDLFFRIEEG